MEQRSVKEWSYILQQCGVSTLNRDRWAKSFSDFFVGKLFSLGDGELPDFLSQILHESGLLRTLEEGLNYNTPERLMQVWPSRFPTRESAEPFVRKPGVLACKVYNDRLGNCKPTHGWDYRGSGLIQVTGKANFEAIQKATGIQCVENPNLLRTPGPDVLRVALVWWEGHVPDAFMGNPVKVRRAVNGGTVGLPETTQLSELLRRIL